MDIEATLTWAKQMVEEALQESRKGNTLPINRLGQNPAFAYYINNVVTTKHMTADQLAYWHPAYVQELDRLRNEATLSEEQAGHGDRLNTLESKLVELTKMVSALVEAQTPKQRAKIQEAAAADEEQDEEPETPAVDTPAEEAPEAPTTDEPEAETEA